MDYKALIDRLIKRSKADESGNSFATICSREDLKSAATAITDLLARAEEAEAQRDEAVHDRMMMEQRIRELNARAEKAEAENAVLRRMQLVKIDGDTLELENEVSELRKKLEKAERERDAAVDRIKEDHWCEDCKFQPAYSICKNDGNCEECESPCFCEGCKDGSLWEWDGWQKEE